MEEKIYQKIKEDEKQTAKRYGKIFGINEEITDTVPKKNYDLEVLLKKLELIPKDSEIINEINKFHDYLIKFGINVGIGAGKKIIIEAIQNETFEFDKLFDINPDNIVKYNMEPTFIRDLKEAI